LSQSPTLPIPSTFQGAALPELLPDALNELKEHFLQLADAVHEVLWISQVDFFRFLYISPAFENIWGRRVADLYEHPEMILEAVLPEDRMCWIMAIAEQALHAQTELEYRIQHPDGSVRWIRTRLFPIREGRRDVLRVAGISEDITERKLVEREILEISDRERQRMGQEIHDGICQNLTGIAYMMKTLERDLKAQDAPEAEEAAHMGQLLRQTIDHARRLARGLYPVELDANGLTSALQQLARNMEKIYEVDCHFTCEGSVAVADHVAATHLYHIAQEALTNAITHGRATKLTLDLVNESGVVYLRVRDNGRETALKS
jgi:PAS domain S-box-containing protein